MPFIRNLLTCGNGKLGEGIHAWSIPAVETCPGRSGLCSRVCYARSGRFKTRTMQSRLAESLAAARVSPLSTGQRRIAPQSSAEPYQRFIGHAQQRPRRLRGVLRMAEKRTEDLMKTLAQLKSECLAFGLTVAEVAGRTSKEPYIAALRDHHWRRDHPDEPLPSQIAPMLLGDWADLDPDAAQEIEHGPGWIAQPKLDGVRALLHVEGDRVRITSRCVSEVSYRLGEFQDNLPHLTTGLSGLDGTILDGELVFPGSSLDTGRTVARHPLQAVTAILSTGAEQARRMQEPPGNRLRFHAFDVLKSRGTDVTNWPLRDRLDLLAQAIAVAGHPDLVIVPTFAVGKLAVHRRILEAGGEGTVWKQLDQPYEPGRRVAHWLKRKRETTVEAVVIGSKPGTPGRGNENLIGAVEFGVREPDGVVRPIAWVSSWTDLERRAMTRTDRSGTPDLNPAYLGRRALIAGQDEAAKSGRLRHSHLLRWIE